MSLNKFYRLWLLSLVAITSSAAAGQAPAPLKKDLVWSQPESEISSPQFSADGSLIVLVTRVHWPDGADAEDLPETFFKKLYARQGKDPRFADPIVRLIDLKGTIVCEARYGTNPRVSPDNKSIAFSRQKTPITGLRALAKTMAGNDITFFACEEKQTRIVAEPVVGYLDNPFFLSDGKSIVYTQNEAVNGAMGGSVGIERVDLTTGHRDVLLSKEATPAVPCQAGSTKSDLQAFMCAQSTKLSTEFPDLVFDLAIAGNQAVVLHGMPVPSPGDMYLAKTYKLNLLSVWPDKATLLPMGQFATSKLGAVSFQPLPDERVMIFSDYWKSFSVEARDWQQEVGPRNANRSSVYSPDGKYYLATEPREDPDHFTLIQALDGNRLYTSPKMEALYNMTWSRDSRRFAVVSVPKGRAQSAYREDMTVYSLPQ